MIQFNLLPDIKMQYIKAKRQKRLVMMVSFCVAAGALTLLVLFFSYVQVAQKKHLSDLNKDVTKYSNQLTSTPDLDKILTIQNQINALPALFTTRAQTSRTFTYIGQVTPSNVTISKLDIDYTLQTGQITGETDTIESINRYVDTLKFTNYQIKDDPTQKAAFSDVVLQSFGRSGTKASYVIALKFDPAIFDPTLQVTLVVPKTITTRSTTEQPTALFNTTAPADGSANQGGH